MKITDYFTPSQENKNEVGQKRTSRSAKTRLCSKNNSQCGQSTKFEDSDSDEAEYCLRKIKIRLADPNVPDSYICEVYDTSPSIDEGTGIPSPPCDGSPLPTRQMRRGSLQQSKAMENTKMKRTNLKRRRGLTKRSVESNVKESDSSSDEALISVRKRVRNSNSTSTSTAISETVQDKVKITGSGSARHSSEKENAVDAKIMQTRTSRRLENKRADHASDTGQDDTPITPKKMPCYMKEANGLGRQDKKANVEAHKTNSDDMKTPKAPHKTPIKEVANNSKENGKKRTPIRATEESANKSPIAISRPLTRARSVGKDLEKALQKTPIKEISNNSKENGKKRTPIRATEESANESPIAISRPLTRARSVGKDLEKALNKTPIKEIANNSKENGKKRTPIRTTEDSANKSPVAISRPLTRARSDLEKSPDVKKEHIERWRTAIKEQCARLPDEAKDIAQVAGSAAESSSSQRRSGRLRTSSAPKNSVKSSRPKRTPVATIKNYFSPPIVETPKLNDKNVQTETKRSTNDESETAKYDLSKTPIKECRVVLKKTPIKLNNGSPTSDCVILAEKINDIRNKWPSNGTKNGNLAPIFLKGSQKKSGSSEPLAKAKKTKDIDPDILKARQTFLQSGVPIAKRKLPDKTTTDVNVAEGVAPFPTVVHVQQRSTEPEWTPRLVNLTLVDPIYTQLTTPVWKSLKNTSKIGHPMVTKPRTSGSSILETLKDVYKGIKIDGIHEYLTERYEEFSDATQELLPVWWDKYRPDKERIVSNERAVGKMTKWLTSWKLYNEELRDGVLRRRRSSDCSSGDDAFVSSDDEGRPSRAPVTACLLSGPTSSGKTALVHSLANHLDLHILEINASSKRSGKKMLSDLQEATQSHKILQESNGSMSRAGDKMSVIVVEEGDVVFEEHDDGYVSGLQSLISSAKRPVIIITSDVSSQYLERFKTNETLQLTMSRPNSTHSCAILELICLLEGVTPSRSSIMRLLNKNQCDLRRSLLEMQFWGQRTAESLDPWPHMSSDHLSPSHLWWASHKAIFKTDLWHNPPSSSGKIADKCTTPPEVTKQEIKSFRESQLLKQFINYAESVSLCDVFTKTSPSCELSQRTVFLKDSICLDERRLCENTQHERLGTEIADEIAQRIGKSLSLDGMARHQLLGRISEKEARMISVRKKASEELWEVIPRHSRDAAPLDYLPALREMCRSEDKRVASNTKRGNRFYHYLRTLGGTPTQNNLQVNCDTLYHHNPSRQPRKCGIF